MHVGVCACVYTRAGGYVKCVRYGKPRKKSAEGAKESRNRTEVRLPLLPSRMGFVWDSLLFAACEDWVLTLAGEEKHVCVSLCGWVGVVWVWVCLGACGRVCRGIREVRAIRQTPQEVDRGRQGVAQQKVAEVRLPLLPPRMCFVFTSPVSIFAVCDV